MKVKLISVTNPVIPDAKAAGAEGLLVYIARVSSGREDKTEKPAPLLRHLITNNHWSPFQMVGATFEITTSRAISGQIIRHWSFDMLEIEEPANLQEFSQRYAAVPDMEPVELREQAQKNRQSSEAVITDEGPNEVAAFAVKQAVSKYQQLLSMGVAKECARMILPMTSQTVFYMRGSLRSWIHYLKLRDDEHAQLEHQRIAQDIKTILGGRFPCTWEALGWN